MLKGKCIVLKDACIRNEEKSKISNFLTSILS